MDNIRTLFESTNFEDKLVALHLINNLSSEEFKAWTEINCITGDADDELEGWHHCDYVLIFKSRTATLPPGYKAETYKKGIHGYYYLAKHAFTIEFERNAKWWMETRQFKVIDL